MVMNPVLQLSVMYNKPRLNKILDSSVSINQKEQLLSQ